MPIATPRSLGRRRKRAPLWGSRDAFFTDAAVFILGAAGAYSVSLVGSFPGDEVLLIPMLPALLLVRGRRAFAHRYIWFYVLALAWLFGTVVGDFYHGSPFTSRIKGIARIVFFIVDFMALAILINNRARRMVVFALSIVVVMLFIARYFQGEFLTQWKFGLSSSVIIVALLGSSYFYSRRKYSVCLGISLALAALNLVYAFRSQVGILLISAALTIPVFEQGAGSARGGERSSRNLFQLIILLVLAGGSGYLANQAFKFAANQGIFDEDVAAKFSTQSEGKLGVLFGGRPETLVAIQAIRDSPIIGHGSFAVDQRYLELKQDIQYEYGYTDVDTPEDIKDPTIPTHSHLTMAWVESGIFGGLFWMYILVLVIRAIFRVGLLRPSLAPLYCYLLVNFTWDILYSPFGNVNRIWGAYLIIMSYSLLNTPITESLSAPIQRRVPVHLRRPPGKSGVILDGRGRCWRAMRPLDRIRPVPQARQQM
jgi:O-antigen ligase